MAGPTAPPAYRMGIVPTDTASHGTFLADELRKIQMSLDAIARMTPQPATKAPVVVVDGMQRLARSPWWPVVAQSADAWVYYDAVLGSWHYL